MVTAANDGFQTFDFDAEDVPRERGIYAILNVVNGLRYVGKTGGGTRSDRNFWRRLREHRGNLIQRRGQHKSGALQDDFTKFGEPAFVFQVLEVLPAGASPELTFEREQFWMDRFDAASLGYNRVPIASAGAEGYKHTAEQIERRKATLAKPDVLARKVASLKAAYADPEIRARTGELARKVHADPAMKAKQRAALKLVMSQPEEKARKAAAGVAAQAAKRAHRMAELRSECAALVAAGDAELAALKAKELAYREKVQALLESGVRFDERPVQFAGAWAAKVAVQARRLVEQRASGSIGEFVGPPAPTPGCRLANALGLKERHKVVTPGAGQGQKARLIYTIDIAIPDEKIAIEVVTPVDCVRPEGIERKAIALRAAGWRVIHFTHAEIARSLEKCVQDVRYLQAQAG
jgi:group I intron endonuclease